MLRCTEVPRRNDVKVICVVAILRQKPSKDAVGPIGPNGAAPRAQSCANRLILHRRKAAALSLSPAHDPIALMYRLECLSLNLQDFRVDVSLRRRDTM